MEYSKNLVELHQFSWVSHYLTYICTPPHITIKLNKIYKYTFKQRKKSDTLRVYIQQFAIHQKKKYIQQFARHLRPKEYPKKKKKRVLVLFSRPWATAVWRLLSLSWSPFNPKIGVDFFSLWLPFPEGQFCLLAVSRHVQPTQYLER